MERDGELRLSEEALHMLQSQSELGEVLEDVDIVEYINDSDEENDIEQSPQSRDLPLFQASLPEFTSLSLSQDFLGETSSPLISILTVPESAGLSMDQTVWSD